MADTSANASKASLGVGGIISESFSILFKNLPQVMILGIVPSAVALLLSGLAMGWNLALGVGDFTTVPDPNQILVGTVVSVIGSLVAYSLAVALLIQLAYAAKLGRPIAIGSFLGPALSSLLPVIVLGVVVGILSGIATLALVIPGLWVYAVYSVVAPAIVIERAGFGGLGRSASLTKEYRWPIVGVLLLIGIINAIFGAIIGFLVPTLAGNSILVAFLLTTILYAFTYGLGGISVALIYARLREIKEGIGIDQIANVFE